MRLPHQPTTTTSSSSSAVAAAAASAFEALTSSSRRSGRERASSEQALAWKLEPALQPYVIEPAALCGRACSPMRWRLRP